MLNLRPYKVCDGDKVVSWIHSETEFRKWSADRFEHYPITGAELNAYYAAMADRDGFFEWTACDDGGPVGHFIMRYPGGDRKAVRFGFVIVDSEKRGRGLGREMLRLAVRCAFDDLHAEKVTLGVFANNEPAHRCYRAAGFREVSRLNLRVGEEDWECIEMELAR